MSNVITFKQREPIDPHANGTATCLDCKHEWEAVIRVTDLHDSDGWLECPACAVQKGRMKYPFVPKPDQVLWVCECSAALFYVMDQRILCPCCGNEKEFPL